MKQISLTEAADFFRHNDNFLLLSHRRPDGDTCGSCAALCRGLRTLGKRASLYANPQFTPKFAPYLEGLIAETIPDGATPVSVDVPGEKMFPFDLPQTQIALAIDHHGTNSGFAAQTLLYPDRAACGEVIWDLLCELGIKADRQMAEAIYVAVSTDTGCFRYSNVTANTFRVAAHCMESGAKVFPINRVMFETKRKPRLALEANLINNMEFYAGGKVSVSRIPKALFEELALTEDDIDDISGFGRTVEGVEIAVMLREEESGKGKVSVRTSPAYNASRICQRLGGGGHISAAGASVDGGIEAAKKAVLASVAEELPL